MQSNAPNNNPQNQLGRLNQQQHVSPLLLPLQNVRIRNGPNNNINANLNVVAENPNNVLDEAESNDVVPQNDMMNAAHHINAENEFNPGRQQNNIMLPLQIQQPDNHNWQSQQPTVKDRIVFLYNNEVLSDVHFILGKGTGEQLKIPAHKFVLSIGSVVFDAMFNGGFAAEPCHDIEIPDIEPASFLSLLRFLYTDEVSIGPDTVMSTLYAAKKYTVPTLEQKCVDFLKSNLGPDNAFTLLSQARLFDEPQLAEMCLACIDKSTLDSFNAEGFTDIDVETLKSVLQRDSLGARESELFNAVIKWADHECRRKDIASSSSNKR